MKGIRFCVHSWPQPLYFLIFSNSGYNVSMAWWILFCFGLFIYLFRGKEWRTSKQDVIQYGLPWGHLLQKLSWILCESLLWRWYSVYPRQVTNYRPRKWFQPSMGWWNNKFNYLRDVGDFPVAMSQKKKCLHPYRL